MLSKEDRMKLKAVNEDEVQYDKNETYDIVSLAEKLKPTSFENAKNSLQRFANKNTSDFGLDQVPSSGGLFNLGDHLVTGDELNKVTNQIQKYLIKLNGVSTDLIREFRQVYTALESLDSEYITAILAEFQAVRLVSEQAKAAAESARHAQEEITKTVQEQVKIVKILENHKERLDRLKHLENIDDIWKTSKELEHESKTIRENLKESKEQLSRLEGSIKSLQNFANSILDNEHLEDIDETWERVGKTEEYLDIVKIDLEDIHAGIRSCNVTIDNIQAFIEKIDSYEHLYEIDSIWRDLDDSKKTVAEIQKRQASEEDSLNKLGIKLSETIAFKNQFEQQEHGFQIDEIWDKTEGQSKTIDSIQHDVSELNGRLDVHEEALGKLQTFENDLEKQEYLFDVDETHENVDSLIKVCENLRIENDTLKTEIGTLKQSIDSQNEIHLSDITMIKNRLMIAYAVGGVALGVGILDIILCALGVL